MGLREGGQHGDGAGDEFAGDAGRKSFGGDGESGKVFTLGPGYEAEGRFESDTFDARIFSHWGRITWMGDGDRAAAAGNVAFYVRSGNTSSPEKNWSAWSGPTRMALERQ